jgi:hypothetical protein
MKEIFKEELTRFNRTAILKQTKGVLNMKVGRVKKRKIYLQNLRRQQKT